LQGGGRRCWRRRAGRQRPLRRDRGPLRGARGSGAAPEDVRGEAAAAACTRGWALDRCHMRAPAPSSRAGRPQEQNQGVWLGWHQLRSEQACCQAPPGLGLPTAIVAAETQTADVECGGGRQAGKAGWLSKPGRVRGRRWLCRAASAGAPRTRRAGAPDMLTANEPTSSSAPKPSSAITAAGSRPRIARCTTATPRRSGAAAKRRPKARLAASGMPSQNEYACVAGASDATCRAAQAALRRAEAWPSLAGCGARPCPSWGCQATAHQRAWRPYVLRRTRGAARPLHRRAAHERHGQRGRDGAAAQQRRGRLRQECGRLVALDPVHLHPPAARHAGAHQRVQQRPAHAPALTSHARARDRGSDHSCSPP